MVFIINILFVYLKRPKTYWSIWIVVTIFNKVVHWYYIIKILSIINMFIVYTSYAFVNGAQFLNATFLLALPPAPFLLALSPVWIITKIWFNDFSFKFNGCTIFISITIVCIILIINNIPFSCCKFWRLTVSIT